MHPAPPPPIGATRATHDVFNQVPPLADYNLYAGNAALREGVAREGAAWADAWLHERGAELGTAEMLELGAVANKYPPTLKLFDATGHRRDEVEFHPAYHQLMAYLKRHGASGGPWVNSGADPKPGAHVARAAFYMLYAEVEDGTLCPTTMTYAVVPALRREPGLARWVEKVLATDYDHRFIPGLEKRGVTMGMGMTEKQGGSDVRANTTRAEYVGESEWGAEYRITGHKWFFSAPMCDAFLILAQTRPGTAEGLTCFFLPRFDPEGRRNEIRIQRLKDKMGDKSNAGSEVEFWGARAWRVGAEGRGVPTILEMGTYTRLDCVLGTAGLMRQAVSQAMHHAAHRSAFGKRLIDQPMMRNVLADLALESEAATALALRLARAFDRQLSGQDSEQEALLARVLTPASKYWVCKRGPAMSAEAMEVWGGNGYVEDGPMARIYRQMPLNSIWEGSGNVMGLDVLRALAKHPRVAEALVAEIAPAVGRNPHFDAHAAALKRNLANPEGIELRARELTQGIALAVQGALLLQHAPAPVAEAFCASRLAPNHWGAAFGTLPAATDFSAILQRTWPPAS